MYKDGLYLSHGHDKHALVIIRQDHGKTLWIRDFTSVDDALSILEEDVLSLHTKADIQANLAGNKGFFTEEVVEPKDGFAGCAFKRYTLN